MVADLKRDFKNKPRFSHTPNHSISFCDGNDGMQNGKHRLRISKYNIMANRSMMATNFNNSFKNHKLIKIRGIARNEDWAIGGKNTFIQGNIFIIELIFDWD